MKRLIDKYLREWKDSPHRKPLLLRGARQVGKTYAVRQLGTMFDNFVEINFEANIEARSVFEGNLDPAIIVRDLSLITGQSIIPGKTLLFFDEIQEVPRALTALRYFYEELPQQHVIAAGSLLDFAIRSVGIPVGRVTSLYMYPLSFIEFLQAGDHDLLVKELLQHEVTIPLSNVIHDKLLALVGEYLAIGGMPEAVQKWVITRDPKVCFAVHQALLDTYRQDFGKYAQRFQIKYLEKLVAGIPRQLGTKFKYSAIDGEYRKRELAPCIDLLGYAGIIHQVMCTAGHGIPLGAEADLHDFKLLFLDVALSQTVLGLDLKMWFLNPVQEFVNKGSLIEAFIGQELLVYADPGQRAQLFYWRRNAQGSEAEIDYLIQHEGRIIPLEVKSGYGSTLKSMRMFLESHPQSPYGLRFSAHNYSVHDVIHSYPLYAVCKLFLGKLN